MIKYNLLIIAILSLISIKATAKENLIDFERRMDKTQSVQAGADFEISSSFSDIDYQTWNKNEVKISVILSVDTKNEKEAERFFDKVDIDYQASSSLVKLKTKWEGNWNSSKDGSFKIQLIVFAPSSINLDLKHSFGATSINEITNAKIDLEYGSLDIGAYREQTTAWRLASEVFLLAPLMEENWTLNMVMLKLAESMATRK